MTGFTGGFLTDDQGRISTTTNAPTGTSAYLDALAFDSSGNLHVTSALLGTDIFVDGKRVSALGQLVVAAGAAPNQPYFYNAGWPLGKVNGESIYLLDTTPIASDPFLAGIRIAAAGGVYMTTGAGGTGTMTLFGTPPVNKASGQPTAGITGYYVLYDTVSRFPLGGYANSQFFLSGNPVTGLTVNGLSNGTTYYATIVAYDGVNQSAPEYEVSKTV
jgi:hypothetical protein